MNSLDVNKMEILEKRIKELEAKKNTQKRGSGFIGLLTLLFIGLKLGNVITWSWWWVLAPLWGVPAIILSLFICIIIAAGVIGGIDQLISK